MPRSTNVRVQKRTKTFTGCWTCRSRKVKCDEDRPRCRRCMGQGLDCGGYGTRLQWLPPVVGLGTQDFIDLETAEPAVEVSSRRSLLPRCSQPVLSAQKVDRIIKSLDATEHALLSLNENETVCQHNFAVFTSKPKHDASDRALPSSHVASRSALERRSTDEDCILPECAPSHGSDASFLETDAYESYGAHLEDTDSPAATVDAGVIAPNDALAIRDTAEADTGDWLGAGGSPPGSPGSGLDLDHFLMRHYAERVCHLFCVVDTPKSPWKTIHLPRALQSMGEVSVTGKTSTVRSALCNALLSISAWYLSNDHYRHRNIELGQRWAGVASKYGYNAIAMLKQAVASDMYSSPKPKYKEFLASMLSMVTINVMSGDTHTCGVHLDGASQLIDFLWNRKRVLSDKTWALYSIYCYLRVIYESTLVQSTDEPLQRERRSESVFRLFQETESGQSSTGASLFEYIYGVPQRLLAMLEETTKLIEQIDHFRAATKSESAHHLPNDIAAASDQLESSILDWTTNSDESQDAEPNTANLSIIHHQTLAFHAALIIFFSQNVRLLDHRYLHPYVSRILASIEEIERIKAEETNMLGAPIFWPAFIAASEAFDPALQARFRKWHGEVAAYGIAAVRTGIDVVGEVWKTGPSREGRKTSVWRAVLKGSGGSLMLS